MRKVTVVLFLLALTACAAGGSTTRYVEEYVAYKRPLAERGTLPWSDYYRGLYNLSAQAGAPGDFLGRVNDAIRDAEQYEAGTITESEFNYRQRALNAANMAAGQRRAQQAQQTNAAQLAVAAQLLQASGPHTLPSPQPQVATSPAVILGFLQNQSVNGALRYCRYSNGVVTTIRSVDLCPVNTQ
jgi:hypothetical protein